MRLFARLSLVAAVLCVPGTASAQSPLMDSVKTQFNVVKGYLTRTAAKVPESVWTFKPTPDVRSFGEIVGHIADANFMICSAASGDKAPSVNAEKGMKTKADLSKALADAFAFCDKAAAGIDDKRALEQVKFFVGGMTPRAMIMSFNTAHNFEHYGNLVTYMRLNKIVPPSSEPPTGK